MGRIEKIGDATLHLGDCIDVMSGIEYVDCLVTDPPYGIGEAGKDFSSRGTSSARVKRHTVIEYDRGAWDDVTADDAVDMAIKRARWSIVFGGNYYRVPPSSCWLVWDKLNTGDFADCELAWTNLPKAVRRIRFLWNGCMRRERDIQREHPTQKPVDVMKWCIEHIPQPNKTILDPFMGSGTTGVAAAKLGRTFIGIEREEKYFDIACRRIAEAYKQPDLFISRPSQPKPEQLAML